MSQAPRHSSTERALKRAAYVLGAAVVAAALAAVMMPQLARFHAKGPANAGHAAFACTDCHREAPGTTRQQLQAKVQFWLGMRDSDVAFGHERVGNEQCATCHAREQDSHPVHRFLEPRFAEARTKLGVDACVSCHREHTGVRVTMPATACATCHQDLDLKREPLDVPHRQLVARQEWQTCLGCHDFHGNHKRVTQTRVDDAFPPSAIRDYLDGGPSPFGRDMKYPAKTGGH
jgi:formate-dependent nitrite reductase cytochrome c552 subunit